MGWLTSTLSMCFMSLPESGAALAPIGVNESTRLPDKENHIFRYWKRRRAAAPERQKTSLEPVIGMLCFQMSIWRFFKVHFAELREWGKCYLILCF